MNTNKRASRCRFPLLEKNISHSANGETCAELNSFVFFLFVEFAPKGALRFRATKAKK
jgi:hypothetical protein